MPGATRSPASSDSVPRSVAASRQRASPQQALALEPPPAASLPAGRENSHLQFFTTKKELVDTTEGTKDFQPNAKSKNWLL